MQLKLSRYLTELRKKAIQFERVDINGKEDKNILSKNFRRLVCFAAAIVLLLLLKNGFNEQFVAYTSTVLSILIGLFISAIIFSFDKFHQAKTKNSKHLKISIEKEIGGLVAKEYLISIENASQQNANEKLWNKQSFNYAKQFAYIIGYSIVLSIFAITFLSFSTMFKDTMSINIWEYHVSLHKISFNTVMNFFNVMLVIVQRFLVVYWVGGVIYYTLFIVSSMVNFMTVKINRENDSN